MPSRKKPLDLIVAESPPMREVVDFVAARAESDCPILIEGEPGTGRELIARVLHLASPRRLNGFSTVKGGTAPTGIFSDAISSSSSVMRRARGGTLLVKDLVALHKTSQSRLTKILCGRSGGEDTRGDVVDVRVIATTEPDLFAAVAAGVVSDELYQCLAPNRIVIPPLRERAEDIAPLANKLIRGYGHAMGRKRIRISTRAYDRMVAYPWPGNVAELKAVCRRLAVRAEDLRVEVKDVEAVLPDAAERAPLEDLSFEEIVRAKLTEFLKQMEGYPLENFYEEVLSRVERPLLTLIMERTGNNQVKAAEILGLNRNTLRRKLQERGIRPQPVARRATMARKRKKTSA
jgi:two-component system nitrogen regulation response regulator GlnG